MAVIVTVVTVVSDGSNRDISDCSNTDGSNSDKSNCDSSDSSNSDIIQQKQLDTFTTDEMFSGQRFAILAIFLIKG